MRFKQKKIKQQLRMEIVSIAWNLTAMRYAFTDFSIDHEQHSLYTT